MHNLKRIIMALAGTLFLLSFKGGKDTCVRDEEKRIEILTTGKWQMVDAYNRYVVKGDTIKRDRWAGMDSCFKDNYTIFGKKGKVYYDQGLLKCNKYMRRIDSQFKWRLDNVENVIWIENSSFTNGLYIDYIDDSVLRVNEDLIFGDSNFLKVYKHVPRSKP